MRPSKALANVAPARRWLGAAGNETGIAMMFILVITSLITIITVAVMLIVAADLSTGIRQMQAVRAFNVAEAGVHHAISKLQTSGSTVYAGETVTTADGATTLGTAVVSVGCIDGVALPCAGVNAAYRRIVSTGTLPEGGPSRTVVVVVQGFNAHVFCATSRVVAGANTTIYGDVGSDGTIDLQGSSVTYSRIRNDPPPPYTNNGFYAGDARATGAITCAQGCPTHVQGTTTPNVGVPVCPTMTMPPFAPGLANQTVTSAGWTMDATTGYDWQTITVQDAGGDTGCTGPTPFADLRIQTGAAGTTTVVNLHQLDMGRCARLVILGEGTVELRVEEELNVGSWGRFGVLPTDTLAVPAPVPAGRLRVFVGTMPVAGAEVEFDGASLLSGTFVVAGEFEWEDVLPPVVGQTGTLYGAVRAVEITLDDSPLTVTFDPTAAIGTDLYFTRLRSWKDQ